MGEVPNSSGQPAVCATSQGWQMPNSVAHHPGGRGEGAQCQRTGVAFFKFDSVGSSCGRVMDGGPAKVNFLSRLWSQVPKNLYICHDE